jgi:hypothetical protein
MNMAQHKTWSCYSCKPVGPCAERLRRLDRRPHLWVADRSLPRRHRDKFQGPCTQRRWGSTGQASVGPRCLGMLRGGVGPLRATTIHRVTAAGSLGTRGPRCWRPQTRWITRGSMSGANAWRQCLALLHAAPALGQGCTLACGQGWGAAGAQRPTRSRRALRRRFPGGGSPGAGLTPAPFC